MFFILNDFRKMIHDTHELFGIQKEVYRRKKNRNKEIIYTKEEYIFFLLLEFLCPFNCCLRRLLFGKTRVGGFL